MLSQKFEMQGHKDTTHNPILPNEKGQMTIFLAICIVIITALLAFIVNIGMMVKAKINFQNALDSAAQAGASVQARYMTNIAYMNWHMRNIYKEWMYKYYVIGHLGLTSTTEENPNNVIDFRIPPVSDNISAPTGGPNSGTGYSSRDPYNIPSVCINFRNSFNICSSFTLPGLPRYESLGLPGVDETHNTFLENLVAQKAEDCSERGKVNYAVLRQWIYGLNNGAIDVPDAPRIALNRDGAYPAALEAAIRIRNLERIVNEPPKASVSANTGNLLCQDLGSCVGINELAQASSSAGAPIHERTAKAFWSAYRNLSKSPDSDPYNMKDTFVLTELSPTPKVSGSDLDKNLSFYLISPNGGAPGYDPTQKHYLDLQLNLVNYAAFYTLFAADNTQTSLGGPDAVLDAGSCTTTKVAIPVPGYPLGFTKNPNILTYYAIKGEAYFTGLFSPFQDPVKFTGYAAAKPYGGRIGPRLFTISQDQQTIRPRTAGYSFPYATGLNLNATSFTRGTPIPYNGDFWVRDGSSDLILGGAPQGTANVKFAIPNMVFDFLEGSPDGFGSNNTGIDTITFDDGDNPPRQFSGLNAKTQFIEFKGQELIETGNVAGAQTIANGILRALAPTGYEAANYMIPTMQRHHSSQDPVLDSIAPIPNPEGESDTGSLANPKGYEIYAPLIAPGLLYKSAADIEVVLRDYTAKNSLAVESYLNSLQAVANDLLRYDEAGGNEIFRNAAGLIFHPAGQPGYSPSTPPNAGTSDTSCTSLAGSFNNFYFPDQQNGCPDDFVSNIRDTWNQRLGDPSLRFNTHERGTYVVPSDVSLQSGGPEGSNDLGIMKYMTGYLPGPKHGAKENGDEDYPLQTEVLVNYRRNYYGVKLIGLRSVVSDPGILESYQNERLALFAETMEGFVDDQDLNARFENGLAEDVRPIRH